MAARDILFAGIILFVFAIIFFVINFTANTMIDRLVEIPAINESARTVEALQGTQAKVSNRLDYVFFGIFMALTISIIITAWFLGGVAIFAVIYIIIWILSIVISSVFAYTWDTTMAASVFGTTLSNFTLTNHILSHLPLYIGIMGFLGLVAMFAKPYFMGEE